MGPADSNNHGRLVDAYIRVSKVAGREGDSFISPVVQEERIRAWAVANGHEVIEVHHELDVSGGKMDRPKLNKVMARIDGGETDGVVVYNLSRFARTLIGSVELIERINERGALFASVSDGFDITTVTGRLVMNILLAIAQSERERSTENWRIARAKAVDRGIHVAPPMFGYLRARGPVNPVTGLPTPAALEVDPKTGPFVTELFERRAAGETWAGLRRWLNDSGVETVRGAPWSSMAVQHIIRNKAYLGTAFGGVSGDLPDGIPDSHPALIDEATWHAAQKRVMARAASRENPIVCRGLVRCAGCRYSMSPRTYADGSWRLLCLRNMHVGDCESPADIMAVSPVGIGLDAVLVGEMWKRLELVEFEGLDESMDVSADDEEIAALESRRDRDALDSDLEAALGRSGWTKHLAGLTANIAEIQERRAEKLQRIGRRNRNVKKLRADWESGDMPMADKRALMGSVIQMVFVKKGPKAGLLRGVSDPKLRRQRLLELIHIVWAHEGADMEIPRQGVPGFKPRPFRFPTDSDPDVIGEPTL